MKILIKIAAMLCLLGACQFGLAGYGKDKKPLTVDLNSASASTSVLPDCILLPWNLGASWELPSRLRNAEDLSNTSSSSISSSQTSSASTSSASAGTAKSTTAQPTESVSVSSSSTSSSSSEWTSEDEEIYGPQTTSPLTQEAQALLSATIPVIAALAMTAMALETKSVTVTPETASAQTTGCSCIIS